MTEHESLIQSLRSWLAGKLFVLAGKLDAAYDVWLDDAPRRLPGENACLDSITPNDVNPIWGRMGDAE